MAKKGRKPTYGVVVQGMINPIYFDYFWAYRTLNYMSEGAMLREGWRIMWDSLPDAEKNTIKRWLEKNPSPRMDRENKMKCE